MKINYEDEIEQVIFDTFKYIYGIEDRDVLYRYLKLRHRCIVSMGKDNQELNMLSKFLLDDLYITKLKYKEEDIYLFSGYDNSIKNIVDSLDFRSQLFKVTDENNKQYEFNDYIDETWNKINNQAIKKSKHYLKDKFYKYHVMYHRLTLLNKLFGVTSIKEVPTIIGFVQDLTHNLSMEEQCLRYIHASNFETNNIKSISEEDLENYLYKNLHLIEEGLVPIKRQLEVEEGRIDILAKDKDGKYVIIELKIANDKHLLWQVIYYPEAIKPIMRIDNPRIITVCPSYPNYIKMPLEKLGYVEMVEYIATITNNKITSIKFKSVN